MEAKARMTLKIYTPEQLGLGVDVILEEIERQQCRLKLYEDGQLVMTGPQEKDEAMKALIETLKRPRFKQAVIDAAGLKPVPRIGPKAEEPKPIIDWKKRTIAEADAEDEIVQPEVPVGAIIVVMDANGRTDSWGKEMGEPYMWSWLGSGKGWFDIKFFPIPKSWKGVTMPNTKKQIGQVTKQELLGATDGR